MSIAPTNSLNISSIKNNAGTSSGNAIKKVSVGGIKEAKQDQKDQASAENNLNNNENTNNTAESRVSQDTPLDRIAKDATNNRLSNFIDQMNQQGIPQNQNSAAAAPPPQQQNGMDPSMLAALAGAGKKEESKPSSSKGSSGSSSKGASEAISKLQAENSKLKDYVKNEMGKISQKKDPKIEQLEDKLKGREIKDPFEKKEVTPEKNQQTQLPGVNFHDDEEGHK